MERRRKNGYAEIELMRNQSRFLRSVIFLLRKTFTLPAFALFVAVGVSGCGKTDVPIPKADPMQADEAHDASSDGTENDDLSRRWREESLRYISSVNTFVEGGLKDGWENAGDEPQDTRQTMGRVQITRGSHVEPDEDGRWIADLAVVQGPRLGPFALRSEALDAEREWLESHWLPNRHENVTRSL